MGRKIQNKTSLEFLIDLLDNKSFCESHPQLAGAVEELLIENAMLKLTVFSYQEKEKI